jgi:GAF domain-containing protein
MSFASGLRQLLALRQTDVVSELRRGETLENILDKHLLTVEGASDGEILTSVLLLSPDGKHLTHGAAPSLPKPYVEAIDGAEIGPLAGSCGTAAYLGEPVYVSDIATDERWAAYRDLALSHQLRSCWSTPIRRSDGGVMATFAIYHRSPGAPTRDELKMIEFITGNVARTITWSRNPNAAVDAVEILPKQVAALQAIAGAIGQHAAILGEEGGEAIDAIVRDVDKLAEIVRAQLPNAPTPVSQPVASAAQ